MLLYRDEPRASARAPFTSESTTEDTALEIIAELLFDVSRYPPLDAFPPGEPAVEVLRDDPMERRLLVPAALVAASPRCAAAQLQARAPAARSAELIDAHVLHDPISRAGIEAS